MSQVRGSPGGSRWQEWVIVLAIAGLFAVGVTAIWGGTIRRWIDRGGDEPSGRSQPAQPNTPGGEAL